MLLQDSGMQFYPLSTGTTDAPAVVAGQPLTWNLDTIPISNRRKANYLPGLVMSFTGVVNTGAAGTAVVTQSQIIRALIDSLQLNNCFHGTPINPMNWRGYWLPTISYIGGGFNMGTRDFGYVPVADSTYQFNFSVWIPLSMGNGPRPRHTAQLAAFFARKNAQFTVQFQPASVLAGITTGAAFENVTVRVSAALFPRREIVVGPGVEWIDYQSTASANQTRILLKSFGNDTLLSRSEPGAAVAFLMAMSSYDGQPGSFSVDSVSQLQIPFRDQVNTTHIHPFIVQQLLAMGPARPLFAGQAMSNGGLVSRDYQDWPYAFSPDNQNGRELSASLRGIPLIPQSINCLASQMQVVSGDADYQMSATYSGTHHNLAQHLRSWSPEFYHEAEKEIVRSGLAEEVYGTTSLRWDIKTADGRPAEGLKSSKMRFLPMVMKPKTAKKK